MMENRPIKFRILEVLSSETKWNYELVEQLQDEYAMKSDYGRDCLNFDLIEMAASGMIIGVDMTIDEDGIYKAESLLIKYNISKLGKVQLEDLKGKLWRGKLNG